MILEKQSLAKHRIGVDRERESSKPSIESIDGGEGRLKLEAVNSLHSWLKCTSGRNVHRNNMMGIETGWMVDNVETGRRPRLGWSR